MESITIIILFLLLTFTSYRFTSSILHPATMMSTWWLVGILFINLDNSFKDVSLTTYFFYFSYIMLFCLGTALFYIINRPLNLNITSALDNSLVTTCVDDKMLSILVIFCMACFPFFLRPYLHILLSGDLNYYFIYTRTEAVTNKSIISEQSFVLRNLPLIASVTSIYCFLYILHENSKRIAVIRFVIILIITILVSLIEAARSDAIRILMTLMFISLIVRGLYVNVVAKYTSYIMSIFFGVSYVMEKGVSYNNTIMENISSFYTYITTYLFGGLIAFDTVLNNFDMYMLNAPYTYNWLLIIINKFGISVIPSSSSLTMADSSYFINIGSNKKILTNVYTFCFPYINDFGIVGSFIVIVILGYLCAFLFYNRNTNIYYIICYSFSLTAMLMSTFSDYFIRSIFTLTVILLFYLLLYKIKPLYSRL